ncbi:MAG: hypothetical protein JXB62_18040 [Pirellulales bacterium]|nr:hypothetical protein [Pirellulales bacterium]
MRNPAIVFGWGLLAAWAVACHCSRPAAGAEDSDKLADDARRLASVRFENGPQQYAGTAYLWLGDVDIRLEIDVKPAGGQVLELLWGSKNDRRDALVTINGKALKISSGGYDGFRWLPIPVPEGVSAPRYEILLQRADDKAAFFGGVRLIGPSDAATAADLQAAVHKIRVTTSAPTRPSAFPEMQEIWDREPPAPQTPLPEASEEAAFRLAEKHARQANEQFFRCRRFVDGWLHQADATTGLIPRNLSRDRDIWNAQDAAADNYPFMVLTAALTDRELFEGRMLEMLRTETKLTCRVGRLPDTWSFSKQAFASAQVNLGSIVFGGSEYVKDGLLPLTEWLGPSPWCDRMLGIVDDLWSQAPIETPYGNIPSANVEVNGEMLQSLSRIYWMTGDEKYLRYAIRLGDYYLLGDRHPTRDATSLRLRDHGCEITSGLSELYTAVSFALPEKKEAYREPIHAMFDRILEVGRNEHGMLHNTINPKTGQHDDGICDTWGYNYNGVYTVYLIDNTEAYREAVRKVLGNLHEHLTTYHWGSADEYADSIEGAINLYNREPVDSAARWIDSEIKDMWSVQGPDGVIEGWHGDGNSARTGIMYALWKTQGLTVQPWRADVRVGTVRRGDTLYVSLTADKAWAGRLLFDRPRHKLQMHLPLDYPRINQFPEWFVAQPPSLYAVRHVGSQKESSLRGEALHAGVPVELKPGVELRLIVSLRK